MRTKYIVGGKTVCLSLNDSVLKQVHPPTISWGIAIDQTHIEYILYV